jgi:hypothetical protein
MTFDEQLHRAFETLAGRLSDELARQLQQIATELVEQARLDREAAVTIATTKTTASTGRRSAAKNDLDRGAAQLSRSPYSETNEAVRSIDLDLSARLLDAIRAIDQAVSLTDILDALTSCASREASRVALFLVRQGELRGWRFVGFGPSFGNAAAIVLSIRQDHTLAEAVRTKSVVVADTAGPLPAPDFAALPGGRESLAVPVAMGGEVIAVLYADQGTEDEPEPRPSGALTWPDSLELMARHAARCLEATTAIKAVRVLAERPEIPEKGAFPAQDAAPGGERHQARK